MAHCTFTEAMQNPTEFIFRSGTSKEVQGFWSDIRVDRSTLPEGWFAYDIRGNDCSGSPCTIEKNYVFVNHCATILTQKEIQFPKDRDWMSLAGRGGWTFA